MKRREKVSITSLRPHQHLTTNPVSQGAEIQYFYLPPYKRSASHFEIQQDTLRRCSNLMAGSLLPL